MTLDRALASTPGSDRGITATDRDASFPRLLLDNAVRYGSRPAYRHKDRGIWQTWTWAELVPIVRAYAAGLARLGLKRGDTCAIIGTNRPRLYWTFTAVQMLGGIPVPVYADSVADELAYVIAHADVRFAVAQDQEQVDKILSVSAGLPALELVLYDEERGLRTYDHTRLRSLDAVIEDGRQALDTEPALNAWLDDQIARGGPDDICIILYTSGTTGRSKGVRFATGRAIRAGRDTVAFDGLTEQDEVLAYLPLAWVGDHYLSYVQGLVTGFCIACPESQDTIRENLREIGPTYYFSSPRVFEALLTDITVRMEDAGALKRWMYRTFIDVARRHGEAIQDGGEVKLLARALYALGERLVYAPLKNMLGFSRVRVAYTAGEAVGPDLFSFYRSIGMNLKQFYGQTEAFIIVSSQPDNEIRADTVGRVMSNVDVRIAADGEIEVRTPGQFIDYLKDPDRTGEALTADGYLRTGDAGFFDTGQHLHIIDRARDVGRLADGTLLAPKYLENKLKFFPNIREAVVFGHQRDAVTCFLNIDLTAVGNWAERNGVTYASYQELALHERVYDLLAGHVLRVNRDLAGEPSMHGAQIRRFLILPKELDADDGEVTRTNKVRRRFITERYAGLIEALYDGTSEIDFSTEVTFEDGRRGRVAARIKIRDVAAAELVA
ncbi:MAG: long-chain acyl-CoA synthetase [Acetobacteraceae bacterium]|nr:long-chain acyl-CoA synthetase [Acetobacteraceae bacterium]